MEYLKEKNKSIVQLLVYILCLYTVYLYMAEASDSYKLVSCHIYFVV